VQKLFRSTVASMPRCHLIHEASAMQRHNIKLNDIDSITWIFSVINRKVNSSRCSDWLWDGRPTAQSSSPGRE
jgi:hypothetical protein